jgi:hypothetical protein
MFECPKHINQVAVGRAWVESMFWSFEFWSFEFVSNFVLRYSNLQPVTEDHCVGPFWGPSSYHQIYWWSLIWSVNGSGSSRASLGMIHAKIISGVKSSDYIMTLRFYIWK